MGVSSLGGLIGGAHQSVGAVVEDFDENDVEGLVPIPAVHTGGLEGGRVADVGQGGSVAGDLAGGGDAAEDADVVERRGGRVVVGDAGDAHLAGGAAVGEGLLVDAGQAVLALGLGVLGDAVVLVEF